ncbi:MAG: enoyl-CoA hydratase-related protein [Elusimicrobiota bacterium]
MEYKHILLDIQGDTATVTLNRPEVRNAMDEQTLAELTHCFQGLGKPPRPARTSVPRAVVLRGAGKDFCSGADIRWMRRAADYSAANNRKDAQRLVDAIRSIDECRLPVIGVIHGKVFGGGLGLVAACDMVVAEESTRMCFSECRLGIIPAVITHFVLPKIGMSHARRLYLSGELFGMEMARHIGLVHEVAPEAELGAKRDFFIKNILRNGPQAMRIAKAYLRKVAALPSGSRVRFSVDTLLKARASKEGKEGFTAFLEKRPAVWVPVSEIIS